MGLRMMDRALLSIFAGTTAGFGWGVAVKGEPVGVVFVALGIILFLVTNFWQWFWRD